MANIVMVHGAWHGAWCWEDHVAPALRERGHAVHTFDLPGHDRPGDTRRNWSTVGSYLDAVDAVVASTGAARDELVLVGHSMGGYLVQRWLEDHDAALGVLVASVPDKGVLGPNLALGREMPGLVAKAAFTADYSHLVGDDELVRDLFFTDRTADDDVSGTTERLQNESALVINTMIVRLPRPDAVASPVEVIAAGRDKVFPIDLQYRLAERYGRRPRIIAGAGHDVMLDSQWPELVDAIDEAIGDHVRSNGSNAST